MQTITNSSPAKQGVWVGGVMRWLNPGASLTETLSDDDVARASRHAFLTIGDGDAPEPLAAEAIVSALGLLEAANEAHWTQAGKPDVGAVSDIAGQKVTRAQIEAAAPDFKRPTD